MAPYFFLQIIQRSIPHSALRTPHSVDFYHKRLPVLSHIICPGGEITQVGADLRRVDIPAGTEDGIPATDESMALIFSQDQPVA